MFIQKESRPASLITSPFASPGGSGILQTTINGILGESMKRRVRRKISAAAALLLEGNGSLAVHSWHKVPRPSTYNTKRRNNVLKFRWKIQFLWVLGGYIETSFLLGYVIHVLISGVYPSHH